MADLLESGDERPGPAARGRDLWHRTVLARLQRRRGRWLSAVGVLLLGAVAAAFWYTRPPAMDPLVRVTYAPLPAVSGSPLGLGNLYQPTGQGQDVAADYSVAVAVPMLTTSWPVSRCVEYPGSLLGLIAPDDSTNVVLVRAGVRELVPPDPGDRVDPLQNAVVIPHSLRVHLQALLDQACGAAQR